MKAKSWIVIVLVWMGGLIGWIAVSVVSGLNKGMTGHTNLQFFVDVFGLIALFTLPVALIVHIVKRVKNKKVNLKSEK